MRTRYFFFFFLTALLLAPARAQDMPGGGTGSNIVSRTVLAPGGARKAVQRVYDNGLGDIVGETQYFQGSNLPGTVVRHDYDGYRRRTRSWLPAVTSDSLLAGGETVAGMAQAQYSDNAPFSRTEYDAFLPAQPSAHYKAGAQWQGNGRKVSVTYSEYVGFGMYADNGEEGYIYTLPGAKYLCTRTFDEDSCMSATYTDLNGRLIISETSQGMTYYVYDVRGNLTYVFPPVLSGYIISHYDPTLEYILESDAMMQKHAYIYRYDNQRHCVFKKLPGCDSIYYVYDRTGACILTQDGNQRQRGEWTYTIPDRFGRPCISGVCHPAISYAGEPLHQVCVYAEYDGTSPTTGGYAVHNLALGQHTLHAANYYDGYSFIGHHGVPSSLTAAAVAGFPVDASLGRGLLTGTAAAVLDGGSVAAYTYSAIYYDSRYNVAQVRATDHLGGSCTTCKAYSYTGKPLGVRIQRAAAGTGTTEVTYAYTYDGADRQDSCTFSVTHGGPGASATLTHEYDGLGRLTRVRRPFNANANGNVDYAYDMHGWLRSITANSFQEELFYADGPGTPCYNGNVSTVRWKDKTKTQKRGYRLAYDDAGRLSQAVYGEGDALTSSIGSYSEALQYDANGNVTRITRNGYTPNSGGLMDNLTLAYDGNRLTGVTETAADNDAAGVFEYKGAGGSQYIYDANGSLVADRSRGIAYVTYGADNNPGKVYFTNGSVTKYVYGASGEKLRVAHYTAKPNITRTFGVQPQELTQGQILCADSTDYLLGGCLVMTNGVMDKVLFDGGYAKAAASGAGSYSFAFYYYNRDHLGNNREVVTKRGAIHQVTNYYPFGAPFTETAPVVSPDLQPYKYNGKELDRMHGLDTYDYGARQYYPILGRWDRMDPLCEKYYDVSPYAYCLGNPVRYIDPDGREIWVHYYDEDGQQQSFQYTAGMQCNVDNSTAQTIVENLNTMYTNGSGAKVIDAIIGSITKYGFMQADTHSENGEGYLNPATNIASLNNVNNTLSFAEEAFHIYQSVNNQGGTTAVNEVEAKLFSAKMNYEIETWFKTAPYYNQLAGYPESPYQDSMTNMFFYGYNHEDYKTAVNNFFNGSYSGSVYMKMPGYTIGTIKENPLIKDFLPVQ